MFCSEKLDQYTTLLHLLCIVGCPVLDRVNLLSAVHQLEERHVVLGLQRDVVEAMNLVFARKRDQNRAPRRIGGGRCRDGAPTRRGWGGEPGFCAKKVQKQGATSHWGRAMSCWCSNATWLWSGACFSGRKVVKSVRHVALEGRDVLLGVQRDVAGGHPPHLSRKKIGRLSKLVL